MDVKDEVTQNFENELRRTRLRALSAGVLHKFSVWVGSGAITWATVVLMGGFASALSIHDFVIVTVLVLAIIILLAFTHFTCKLVTKKSLSTGSLQPLKLVYQDKRLKWVTCIKCCSCTSQILGLVVIFSVSFLNIRRSKLDLGSLYGSIVSSKPQEDSAAGLAHFEACLKSCNISDHLHDAASALRTCAQLCFPAQSSYTDTATTNLQICKITFYLLVIITSFLVCLCNFYILWRISQAWRVMRTGGPKNLSLTRYHDEVLSRSLNLGLVDADEFDEMEFLMRGVGEDLVGRKIAPLEVKRQNADFIKYSLYHPNGVEMVMEMLASEDTVRQQTAANMPGFWSSEPERERMKKVGMELLSKLGEKLGFPGKVAEGAANSFKSLAAAWHEENQSPLLRVYVSRSGGQGAGKSHQTPVPTSAISSTVGESEATDAVSRSEGGTEGQGGSVNAISRSDGLGGCAAGSISTAPESGQPVGQGIGQVATTSRNVQNNELKWNVVQKVVDLVLNKRLPTLQVYVRALDAFFMSQSIREWLTEEEKDRIKRKLRGIIAQGGAIQGSAGAADRVIIRVGSSTKARTKLLVFSALERLGLDPEDDQLLQTVNDHLKRVEEGFVIWIEEVKRFEKLCQQYPQYIADPVNFYEHNKWEIRGIDLAELL